MLVYSQVEYVSRPLICKDFPLASVHSDFSASSDGGERMGMRIFGHTGKQELKLVASVHCLFISFKQIVSILIDFSCGKRDGFA